MVVLLLVLLVALHPIGEVACWSAPKQPNQSAFPRPFAWANTAGGGTGGAFMSPMYTALLTSSA